MRPLLALLSLCLLSCARAPVAAEAPAAPVEDDCTLATPLAPGVPGSPGHLIASERNPNGASELATLMRQMQSDLTAARETILAGGAPPALWSVHRKLRCTWPTDLSDRTPDFDAMAVNYLAAVKALDARPADLKLAHTGVLAACTACHENTCPGPIEAIQALRLP